MSIDSVVRVFGCLQGSFDFIVETKNYLCGF